ncbi:hypothetical protein [[Curtobacterium] plantarum]|uniref:hypothetical protein n=1 Tax=[Curtobacterium] plantarum TaxID=221276 RepID=UPI001FC8F877|nr:hypothetical protein [[Curtobacterium] plantarum]
MIRKVIALVIISLSTLALVFYPFFKHKENFISCNADVSYHLHKKRLNLLISQNMSEGKGIISISGISYENEKVQAYVNKIISFSFKQNKDFYYFRSEIIIDSPQMNMPMSMSIDDQRKWLPEFFINSEKTLLVKIKPYGMNSWLFYSGAVPLFVCERNH